MSSLLHDEEILEDKQLKAPVKRRSLPAENQSPVRSRAEITKSLLERHFKMPLNEETDLEVTQEIPEPGNEPRQPALESRNVTINGKRTSIRLEPNMWDALEEICVRERRNMHQTCTHIHNCLACSSFTAAVRVYTLSYFRVAATEMGHSSAGHGPLKHEPKFVRRY